MSLLDVCVLVCVFQHDGDALTASDAGRADCILPTASPANREQNDFKPWNTAVHDGDIIYIYIYYIKHRAAPDS